MTNKGKNLLIGVLAIAGVTMYGHIQKCAGYIKGAKVVLEAQQESENESEEETES